MFYHVNDPTGTSLVLANANGDEVGRTLYDGFGTVLTTTLPLTLTGSLLETPDAATGLVYRGNGRWYDPALGRPLQPNAAGGPPTVPQALNRYTATPIGQPGVYQAMSNGSIPPVLQSVVNQIPGLVAGEVSQAVARNFLSSTVYRMAYTGYGIVQAEGTARQIAALAGEWQITSTRLADGFLRKPVSYLFSKYRIQTAQRHMFVGKNLQYLDDYAEGLGINGVQTTLLKREMGSVVDEFATLEAQKLGVRLSSRGFQTVLGGTASAFVQLAYDYNNPYLTTTDKGIRAGVSFSLGAGAAYAGTFIAGPIGTAVGFVIGAGLDYFAAPWIFERIGVIPERNLAELTQ